MDYTVEDYVQSWMPTIASLAYKYANRICSPDDLISEGMVAVISAVNEFDPEIGQNKNSLHAFVKKCLNNALISASVKNSTPFSLPSGANITVKKMRVDDNLRYLVNKNLSYQNKHIDDIIDIKDLIQRFDTDGIAWSRLVDNEPVKEIAEEKGISKGKVYYVTKRVRENVRSMMS